MGLANDLFIVIGTILVLIIIFSMLGIISFSNNDILSGETWHHDPDRPHKHKHKHNKKKNNNNNNNAKNKNAKTLAETKTALDEAKRYAEEAEKASQSLYDKNQQLIADTKEAVEEAKRYAAEAQADSAAISALSAQLKMDDTYKELDEKRISQLVAAAAAEQGKEIRKSLSGAVNAGGVAVGNALSTEDTLDTTTTQTSGFTNRRSGLNSAAKF